MQMKIEPCRESLFVVFVCVGLYVYIYIYKCIGYIVCVRARYARKIIFQEYI